MFSQLSRRIYFSILFLFLGSMILWTVILIKMSYKDSFYNYLYNAGLGVMFLYGTIPLLVQIFNSKINPLLRRIFIYFALGQLAWALGSFGWMYYNIVVKVEVPVPSFADILYYSYYIFVGIGCLLLLRYMGIHFSWKNVLGPFLVMFIAYILVAFFLNWNEFSSQPFAKAAVDFMYPVCDAILFSIAFIIFNNGELGDHKYSLYLVIGLLIQVLGDILFSVFVSLETYWNGSAPDLLYAMTGFFLAIAMFKLVEDLSLKNPVTMDSTDEMSKIP